MKSTRVVSSVVALCLSSSPIAFAQQPAQSWAYKPFSITSTKQKKEMGDAYISKNLMCKTTTSNMSVFMDLIQNYDLIDSSAGDGTISMSTFRGKQNGAPVQVMLAVDSRTKLLSYVWVDGKPALHCNF